jgi:hypothetical protein
MLEHWKFLPEIRANPSNPWRFLSLPRYELLLFLPGVELREFEI